MIDRKDAGDVAVLSLVNGQVNIMDTALLREITQVFTDLAADRPAAVVLTGSGRAFSAGVDLRSFLDGGAAYTKEFLPALSEALLTVFTADFPVVTAVNGHAIAGGAVLAACADARVMAEGKGRIGIPEAIVGVAFPRVALDVMVHAVGPQVANRLVFGADLLAPAQALALGLVDEVVDADTLLDRSVEVATRLATAIPADTFTLTKRQLRRDTVDRIARYRVDEDVEVEQLWNVRSQDGWTASYLERATKK
ncbi:enoyl-CoA hydratase/isomerase family protein [Pseudonocardia spinosispora]|uniref:enoyl-CoA hydratase/isomerase family protein n=1 Tax=Pseudonocardia spinosispora TaxID=103441 RepID=UPI000419A475|nr:enoyl-CoA hydratase/isomerase family protein [Pseudonocardia spinosispora]